LTFQIGLACNDYHSMFKASIEWDVDLLGLVHNKLERDQSRKCFCGRVDTVYLPHDDGNASTRNLVSEDVRMVRKQRRRSPVNFRQRDPELDPMQSSGMLEWRLFGVCDAGSGGHQIEFAGMQKSLRTQAVSVQHLPFKQPRYGLKADVRMWRYVHRLPVNEFDGPKVVEKTPRTNRSALPDRQRPSHAENANFSFAGRKRLNCRSC